MTKARQRERKKTRFEREAHKRVEWENKIERRNECLRLLFGVKEEYSDEEIEAAHKAATEGMC